jgi:hypothetical protein
VDTGFAAAGAGGVRIADAIDCKQKQKGLGLTEAFDVSL